ncbi:MAG: branched-chain amino acid ABC transporter permease [Alphaproteobacteria bacterium]|nr:branched-chain amino acid ABC transporter permease [Alphaproteobacteria bacterium]
MVDDYLLTVLTQSLFFAYLGQSWNVMMGFAGLLSLGHAMFVGLGAYVAGALFVHFGLPPVIGLFPAMALAALVGAAIGFLGFRFSIQGVYFALLTIAFAEFIRILFDHFTWVGGSSGLFIPVDNRTVNDLVHLRGTPEMFYYLALGLSVAALALSRLLLAGRLGHRWLAIREDQEAAQALGIDVFRAKMAAVVLSAAMTSLGGVFYAFYFNNMFPEQIFNINLSIELLLGPIIGGLGTLIGPILGAFVLTPLSELLSALTERHALIGIKHFVYGLCVVLIVVFLPGGLWPWIARRLGLDRPPGDGT